MLCDTAVLFCEHLFSSEVSDNSGDVSCTKNKINLKNVGIFLIDIDNST